MCKLTNKNDNLQVKGYKVAYKEKSLYYSIATGIEYKIGPVPTPTTQYALSGFFAQGLLNPKNQLHKKDFYGKTAVFSDKDEAHRLKMDFYHLVKTDKEIVILKMKLSGDLWDGTYEFITKIVAGNHIDSIKEIGD